MLRSTRFYNLLLISFFISANFITAQNSKEFEKTLPLEQTGTVSIETYKGSISVDAWDKNEVKVYAKVVPDDNEWSSTSPEEQLRRCEVTFDHSNNSLSLKSDYEKNYGHDSETMAFVHYTIKMPSKARLIIEDYKSETVIENLSSSIKLDTYKGKVRLTNFAGEIDLETYKGDVTVELSELNEKCKFDTYKGDISLELPKSSKFDFDFDLGKKGDFSSDFDMVMNSYRSSDGEVRGSVNGGGPRISFSTYKGEIELREK